MNDMDKINDTEIITLQKNRDKLQKVLISKIRVVNQIVREIEDIDNSIKFRKNKKVNG